MRRHAIDIGRRLARLRNALGLTQEDVAQRARLTAKYLSEVENGRSDPSVGVFMRIVELGLQMPLTEFFAGEAGGVREDLRDDASLVLALLAGQSPAMRRRALRVLKALCEG